ncbi:MAG: DUF438 domain-containing protein [FCB group bacterium]|jgi:DUF438 domain-containing protein
MSELINNSLNRKRVLKDLILHLHEGTAPEEVKKQLVILMGKVPYGEVVEVEQELISEGLPTEEVLRLCDIHSQVLDGNIDLSGQKSVPRGHPVDTFIKENTELLKVVKQIEEIYSVIKKLPPETKVNEHFLKMRSMFNSLSDVDKHYKRKEYLLFPFLEKYGITGPPTVMWGKHDEIRGHLNSAIEAISVEGDISAQEAVLVIDMVLSPASNGIADMKMKEEEILFPMSLDKLSDVDWYHINEQTNDYGFCLYDPKDEWKPENFETKEEIHTDNNVIHLPSGSFTAKEINAILNTIPFDITFVDKNDKVSYFSQGTERIFDRSRAILKRDVRMCHPPGSVHIVNKIIEDFKSGKAKNAPFWINLHGKFLHIEYFALRGVDGEYLGTLEVSQDLTEKKTLEGEKRLLSYAN